MNTNQFGLPTFTVAPTGDKWDHLDGSAALMDRFLNSQATEEPADAEQGHAGGGTTPPGTPASSSSSAPGAGGGIDPSAGGSGASGSAGAGGAGGAPPPPPDPSSSNMPPPSTPSKAKKRRKTASSSSEVTDDEDDKVTRAVIKEAEKDLRKTEVGRQLVQLVHGNNIMAKKERKVINTKLDKILSLLGGGGGSAAGGGGVNKQLAEKIDTIANQVDDLTEQKREDNSTEALKEKAAVPWIDIAEMKEMLQKPEAWAACLKLSRRHVNNYAGGEKKNTNKYGTNFGELFIHKHWHGRFFQLAFAASPEPNPTLWIGGFPYWQVPVEFRSGTNLIKTNSVYNSCLFY